MLDGLFDIDRLAAQLESAAQQVRDDGDDQLRRAQAARWVSTTAKAYRQQVARDRSAAYTVADRLAGAAAALRAHAEQVRAVAVLASAHGRGAVRPWLAGQPPGGST